MCALHRKVTQKHSFGVKKKKDLANAVAAEVSGGGVARRHNAVFNYLASK